MSSKKAAFIVFIFLVIFLLVRLPGISVPYHQDEWKNVSASSNIENAGEFFAHPPLMQMMFVVGYKIFGADNFRFIPLIFSLAGAALLFLVLKNRAGKGVAFWSLGIFLILFYNVLGSLVPDVDGSILPFFFLLSIYFYDKWNAASGKIKWKWFALLATALLIGFLTKLSFILVVGTITLDYIFNNWRDFSRRKFGYVVLFSGFFGLIYVGLLYLISAIYPPFDMKIMFGHASQFSEGEGRNWIQIAVQGVKTIFYLSPLAFIPLLFISKDIIKRTRVFWIYLIVGAIFYFIVFDFSRGALDKYLMFAIVPLSIIVGHIFSRIFSDMRNLQANGALYKSFFSRLLPAFVIGLVLSALLILANFLSHEVLPLYPKTLWFSRVLHGEWLILNPFNGGSGPLGFYVSFLFIAAAFVISAIPAGIGLWKKAWRPHIAVVLLMIGISYNAVFAEEFFAGKINGSAPKVLKEASGFIEGRDDIKKVITYNDIGAGLVEGMGKYAGRIYATPESENGYKELFAKHSAAGGHYLIVGIPPLGPNTFYGKFFANCDSLFESKSGEIRANVYKCNTK